MVPMYPSPRHPNRYRLKLQRMLDFNDDRSLVDTGLPESLGELEINSAPSADSVATPVDPAGTPSLGVASLGSSFSDVGVDPSGPDPSDLPNASDLPGVGGFTTSLTDLASDQSGQAVQFPNASKDSGASAVNAIDYPSTGSTFDLPDPNMVASDFASSPQNRDAQPSSDFALASGTSDSDSSRSLPGVAEVQTAELAGASATPNLGLSNAIETADKQYLDDKRRDALATLSIFYNTPNLSGEQRSELLSRLDPLAREVIYSTRHLLEQPHRVGQNETLMEIAAKYEVPWQLLANINQVKDPVTILPGTELKVVRGPFRAEVDLTLNELTLFLGDLYAGRFPVAIGSDPSPKAGTYTIQDKQTAKTFYNQSGSPVPPGSPENPYGSVWLDLGSQICIHGSPSTSRATDKGCISLAADYAHDLYGILSQGSSVTIRR